MVWWYLACDVKVLILNILLRVAQATQKVKARSSEVRRFPGIGFSSCTAPTFSHVQGILSGGYESGFQNVLEWSSILEQFWVWVGRREKRRFRVVWSRGVWYARNRISLSEESSRSRRMSQVRVWVRYSECGNIHDKGNLNTRWNKVRDTRRTKTILGRNKWKEHGGLCHRS